MKVSFATRAWEDYLHWQSKDIALLAKINGLVGEITRHPFTGTGRPEPLSNQWGGWWSRRITSEHRLIYRVIGKGEEQRVEIAQCRLHYR